MTEMQTDRLPKTAAKIEALRQAGDTDAALNVVFSVTLSLRAVIPQNV